MDTRERAVVSVQARMGSTRLPGKVLLALGDTRVIGRVVDQCLVPNGPDVVVTTGESAENDAVKEWCRRADVPCLTGPEDDLLKRHRSVAHRVDADCLVRVTGDCPFVPQTEIERLLDEHRNNGARYTTNYAETMPVGTAVDVLDRSLLDDLSETATSHPVKQPRAEPERWETVVSPNPEWERYRGAHIAVDTPADYWTLVDAVDAVGDDSRAVAAWVADTRLS